jgi:Uma2 family endonuclease
MSTVHSPAKVVLGLEHSGIMMTPDEFDAIEEWDDTFRYELIRGLLIVSPYPLEPERDVNDELGCLLRSYQPCHPQGTALDVTLHEQTVRTGDNRRRADRVLWAGLGRRPDPVVDIPTIVVDFVSAARRDCLRDYQVKCREYLSCGVAEYWLLDRFRRTLTVTRHQPPGPEQQVLGEHDLYRTPRLPGFELPLARLFAVTDDWK